MILVDTSVLVDYLKGLNNNGTQSLDYIIDTGIPYGITDYIYQELLQGSRTKDEYQQLKDYFETIPFFYLQLGKESFEKAAMLYFNCRRSGITIRSTIDLLIAETAIENNLYLLQNDNDFIKLSKIVPELKLYRKK